MEKICFSHLYTTKNKKTFGFLPSGEEVFNHTISNKNGIEIDVINYGATITSIRIPANNTKVDIVLGFDNLESYINSFHLPSAPYLGTIVGRYAGRISEAKFQIDGEYIHLNKNHGNHNLHGGNSGFSIAFWNVISLTENSIKLEYISQNNEENFPGELTTTVTYTITDTDELQVEMMAKSTENTIINLTQHSYFNLDGHSNDIKNQKLFVNSSHVLKTNSENIPTGKFIGLNDHLFDYRQPKKCPTKIDNTFILNKESQLAASLFSKKNKLKMSVFTNQPAVHIYVGGNCFNQINGKENASYHSLSGICFEVQNFPDAPNHNNFPNAVLKKDETYIHNTTFKFETI